MTNAEKYLKDGVDIPELWKNFSDYYYKNKSKESDVAKAFKLFFCEQATPVLTEDERVILRNIDKKRYQKIERDWETLWIHGVCKDGFSHAEEFTCYEHLFQFIKKGEEYSIQELLGDEE